MLPSWIVIRCLTGREWVQRLGVEWVVFSSPPPCSFVFHFMSTPLANNPLPQSSAVTKFKIAACDENVHLSVQNTSTPALQI